MAINLPIIKIKIFTVFIASLLSSSSLISQTVNPSNYCASNATDPTYERIESFNFKNISYSNAIDCQTYQDFTSTVVEVIPGERISGTIQIGTCTPGISASAAVFIDWNGDFDFLDEGEKVFQSVTATTTDALPFTITVPAFADMGDVFMLRIIAQYGVTDISSCGEYNFGETQDYSLKLLYKPIFTDQMLSVLGSLSNTSASQAVDANNDGAFDLFIGGKYFQNDNISGQFSFSEVTDLEITDNGAFDDFDNNGYLDFISSENIKLNDGSSFSDFQINLSSSADEKISAADVDADGDLDILVGDSLYLQKRLSGFEIVTLPGVANDAFLADFDNDSDYDIISKNSIYSNSVSNFTLSHQLSLNVTETYYLKMDACDINNDGQIDFIRPFGSSSSGSGIYIDLVQQENNVFTKMSSTYDPIGFGFGNSFSRVLIQDLDNDGIQELVFIELDDFGLGSFIKIFNIVDGEFLLRQIFISEAYNFKLIFGDFDNDDLIDIIDFNAGNPLFVKNISLKPVGIVPSTPIGLKSSFDANGRVVLEWQKATDLQSPSESLSYNIYLRRGVDTVKVSNATKDGSLKSFKLGNTAYKNKYIFDDLPSGEYHWSVQSIDNGFNSSKFSTERSFTIENEENVPINIISGIKDGQLYLNKAQNEYYVFYSQNSNLFLQRLTGPTSQKIGSPIKINDNETNASEIKVSFDKSSARILVCWKHTEIGQNIEIRGKVIQLSNFNSLIPETVFMNHIPDYDFDFDMAETYVGNSFPILWARVSANPGLSEKILEYREIEIGTSQFLIGDIIGLNTEGLDFFITEVALDLDPIQEVYLFNVISSDTYEENGDGFFSSISNLGCTLKLQIYNTNLETVGEPYLTKYSFIEDLEIGYNPISKSFLYTYKEYFSDEFSGNGLSFPYSYEVTGAKLSIVKSGSNYLLNYARIPFNLSKSSVQGVENLGTSNPKIGFNSNRNEFLLSWYNTLTKGYRSQRLDESDQTLLYTDEIVSNDFTGQDGQFIFNELNNSFLSMWKTNSGSPNNITSLVYRQYKTPKDLPPVLNSMDSYSAYAGEEVEILGSNFGKLPFLNKVYFGDIEAEIKTGYDSRSRLSVIVPEGLGRAPVAVSVLFDDQEGSSEEVFTFEALTLPTVSGISPLVGEAGEEITITGEKFPDLKEDLTLSFGGMVVDQAAITANSNTSISFVVPANTIRGKAQVAVTVQGQTVAAVDSFRVIVAPRITEISPLTGVTCNNITIKGSNFSEDLSAITVRLNDYIVTAEDMVATSANTILLRLPAGLSDSLSVSVTTDERADTFNIKYFALSGADILSETKTDSYLSTAELAAGKEVGIGVRANCALDTAFFFYRFNASWDSVGISPVNNFLSKTINTSLLGSNTSMEYYFEVTDRAGNKQRTATNTVKEQSFSSVEGLAGESGDTITIKGEGFSTSLSPFEWDISLGGIQISSSGVVTQNDSILSFKVPVELARGLHPLSGSLRGKPLFSNQSFRKIIPPSITNIEPLVGTSCTEVTISGTNFSEDFDKLRLSFGDSVIRSSEIIALSATEIRISVPEGLSGNFLISVTVDEITSIFNTAFEVQRGIDIQNEKNAPYIELTKGIDKIDVGISLRDDCTLENINFYKKGITSPAAYTQSDVSLLNGFYQATLTEEDFDADPLGVEYFFEVVDVSGDTLNSVVKKVGKYLKETDSVATDISAKLVFGSELEDYQIIGLPYVFTPNDVSFVFKDLPSNGGVSNIKKWRMFRYNNGSEQTEEYGPSTFNTVNPGEGYWVIMKEEQSINLVDGQTVDVTAAPFTITLSPGWNQIGNPYLFDLNWNDIVAANGDMSDVEDLVLYENGTFTNGTVLKAYAGGFVNYNGSSAKELILPYAPTTTNSNRQQQAWQGANEAINIASASWRLPISLSSGNLGYKNLAIGEHEQAEVGVDKLDQHLVPSFILPFTGYFEVASSTALLAQAYQPSYQAGVQSWKLTLSNQGQSPLTLSWSSFDGIGQESLWLYDKAANRLLDMQAVNSYAVSGVGIQEVVLLKGDKLEVMSAITPSKATLSTVYPNPFESSFALTLALPETAASYEVVYQLVDAVGKVVYRKTALLAGGYHEQQLSDAQLASLEQGVYVLQVMVDGASMSEQYKLIKR